MSAHLVEQGFESIPRLNKKNPKPLAQGLFYGAPGGIRTPDQVVRSHLLYPAELRVRSARKFNLFLVNI